MTKTPESASFARIPRTLIFLAAVLPAAWMTGCGGKEETPPPAAPASASPGAGPAPDASPAAVPGDAPPALPPAPGRPETAYLPVPHLPPGLPETAFTPSAETTYKGLNIPAPASHKTSKPQTLKLDPQAAGGASASLVADHLKTGTGSMATARPGDYLLTNGAISLYFARIRPKGETKPAPQAPDPSGRREGALIDVTTSASPLDFLGSFTQALGIDPEGPLVDYDSAEFVRRDDSETTGGQKLPAAAGVRLTGSVFEGDLEHRVQTTYWLAPGAGEVMIESQVVEGDPGAPIADHAIWGPGTLFADTNGPPGPAQRRLDMGWYVASAAGTSLGVAVFGENRVSGTFGGNVTRAGAYFEDKDGLRRPRERRFLYVAPGDASAVTDRIFTSPAAKVPASEYRGRIVFKDTNEPVPGARAEIFWYDRSNPKLATKLYTRATADANGRFSLKLPLNLEGGKEGRYFVGTKDRARGGDMSSIGIVVKEGAITERDLYVSDSARLLVKAVDAATSEPLAARVRFEALPPTPSGVFDGIASPRGYLNNFYIPREGAAVELPQGAFTIFVSAGIEYEVAQADVRTAWGSDTEATVRIRRVNPAPEWTGLHIGAMTRATPGCLMSPEEVLMTTAGEGLQWIVSGDYETLTDFAPVIAAAGLKGEIGSSLGFRTSLPARPEWGEFLVYPVAPGSPDPAAVRDQWKGAAKAKDFTGAIRRLYPGAMIEAITPYVLPTATEKGRGYYFVEGWQTYQMAFDDTKRPEEIDLTLEAANVHPSRKDWNYSFEKDFYFIHLLRGRHVIPAPVSEAKVAFRGEPGYPRLLVRTGKPDIASTTEADVFGAMKAGRWQITSGPIVEFYADGRREGETYKAEKKPHVRFKVTAPVWAPATSIDMSKDGIMTWREADQAKENLQAVNFEWAGEVELYPELKEQRDTLLNAQVWSIKTIDDILPPYGGPGVPSFAWGAPVFADTNGNGQWDPPIYRDKGK